MDDINEPIDESSERENQSRERVRNDIDNARNIRSNAQRLKKLGSADHAREGLQDERDVRDLGKLKNARKLGARGKKGLQTLKVGTRIARGAAMAVEAGEAIIGGVSAAAATIEIWGPILLILIVVILLVVLMGGGAAPPACQSITLSNQNTSPSAPVTLTLEGCDKDVVYSWQTPKIGGSLNATNSATTIYTPPSLTTETAVSLTAGVCKAAAPDNCSSYVSPQIKIIAESPPIDTGPEGVFEPPFMCSPHSKYLGSTYIGHTHWAVDFNRGAPGVDFGDPVYSAADGLVIVIIPSNGEVWILHKGGYVTAYAHMSVILVRIGERVGVRQQIGKIGNRCLGNPGCGSHLHYHVCGQLLACIIENTNATIQIKFNSVAYPASCYNCSHSLPGIAPIDCNWP